MSAARTARDRARVEVTSEILTVARHQLAEVGPADLSLRAISRQLGMASSALYRYFPSRDALLTALIIEAYDEIGAAVEDAEAAVERDDLAGRWRAATRAARTWALDHPHQYALIYGSPVPGYAAPEDTIDPAARVGLVLVGILRDAAASDRLGATPAADVAHARPVLAAGLSLMFAGIDEPRVVGGIMAWTTLFGVVNFELFGHYENLVVDRPAYFDEVMRRVGRLAGLDV